MASSHSLWADWRRFAAPGWFGAAMICLALAPASAAVPADDIRSAARQIFKGGAYQTELIDAPPGDGEFADDPQGLFRRCGEAGAPACEFAEPPARRLPLLSFRSFDGTWILVLLGMVLALVAAWIVWQSVRNRLPAPAASGVPDAPAAQPLPEEPAGDVIARAIALANDGRLTEAVRLLLASAVEVLRAAGGRVEKATTSREILRALTSPAAVSAFAPLVRAVEQALFRGAAIDRSDVDMCVENYRRFRADVSGVGNA